MTQDEFYENIPAWISKDRSTWNHITLMAYFCYKYEKKHNARFRLVRWKSDPGKGKESRDFAKLFDILSPDNYKALDSKSKKVVKKDLIDKIYNYINWMFDYKFRRGDRSVTGTGLFLMPSMINEFERMYLKHMALRSTESKMSKLISWAENNIPDVLDRHDLESIGDLKMIKAYAESYSLEYDSCEHLLIRKAKELEVL